MTEANVTDTNSTDANAVDPNVFDLAAALPSRQWLLLEASAGTGKTYSLTALVARYVAEQPEQ